MIGFPAYEVCHSLVKIKEAETVTSTAKMKSAVKMGKPKQRQKGKTNKMNREQSTEQELQKTGTERKFKSTTHCNCLYTLESPKARAAASH